MKIRTNLFAALILAATQGAYAAALLSPGDPIIAVNPNVSAPNSSSPAGEPVSAVIDGGSAKYLNGGGAGTGFIATPSAPVAMQSFVIQTGNDANHRDPYSYEVWGTNDAITSTNNSTGTAENWVLISSGNLNLSDTRNFNSDPISFTNTTAYSSYKVVFPQTKYFPTGGHAMQINEFTGFTGTGGTGSSVFAPGNPIIAIDTPVSTSYHWGTGRWNTAAESATSAIDGSTSTKYLNFGGANSGFIVTPNAGQTVVSDFTITTAMNAGEAGRDPASYILYGTNESILTVDNGFGTENTWVEIASGSLTLTADRGVVSEMISVGENETPYTSYKMLFPSVKDNASTIFQIGEVQLYGTVIPEPSVALLSGLAVLGLGVRRRR